MSDTPRTNAMADRFGEIDPDSPYWVALDLATEFERKIEAHNAECVRLCDDRKSCGYEGYSPHMSCPNCPKNWMVE